MLVDAVVYRLCILNAFSEYILQDLDMLLLRMISE